MPDSALSAISPVDGRYHSHTNVLSKYFSEAGLMKYRLRVEIEYFIALRQIPLPQLETLDISSFSKLRSLYEEFDLSEAEKIKVFEKKTNHDVKAVEYFLKEKFDGIGLSGYREFLHFGLTSQDINNTAIPLLLKEAVNIEIVPRLKEVVDLIRNMGSKWKNVPMLAHTHGQPASPTRLGKEMEVFTNRIEAQLKSLESIPFAAKFGGATGNFNAHRVTHPDIDWHSFATTFVNETLGLNRSFPTTQIEHYDHLAALCDNFRRINNILIDFCQDTWHYISLEYFRQKINENETGSSAMPHKVNPIDFENAEGNFGISSSVFNHLSSKLPVSRLQRDLTDSTVLRNLGVPFAHLFIALSSLEKGIGTLELNESSINDDLDRNWSVVAEGIQNILRREGFPEPFEALKALTRTNAKITQHSIHQFIDGLDVSSEIKDELKAITPFNYVGI